MRLFLVALLKFGIIHNLTKAAAVKSEDEDFGITSFSLEPSSSRELNVSTNYTGFSQSEEKTEEAEELSRNSSFSTEQMQSQSVANCHGYVIMGYYTSWSIYERNFYLWDVDLEKITHLTLAFATIDAEGKPAIKDPWGDIEIEFPQYFLNETELYEVTGNLKLLRYLKGKHGHLKTGLAIGGWTDSGEFSNVFACQVKRNLFIKQTVALMQEYDLDYIDIDWEYPIEGGVAGNAHRPTDGENFVLFVRELRQEFDSIGHEHWGIVITLPGSQWQFKFDFVLEMIDYASYFNLMTYDYTGPWTELADHHANLYARQSNDTSISKHVDDLIEMGIPARMIIMGVPMYGRSFANCSGLMKEFSGVGKGSWEPGTIDYKHISMESTGEFLWDDETKSSYVYDPQNQTLISFDDDRSLRLKLDFVKLRRLAGVMFWELSGDYPTSDERSLLRISYDSLKQ